MRHNVIALRKAEEPGRSTHGGWLQSGVDSIAKLNASHVRRA